MEQISVTKLDINEKPHYIQIFWKPNKNDIFHIKIFEDNTSWSGQFSHELAKTCREDTLDNNEEEYYNNVKRGLSKDPEFSYAFEKSRDNNSATFKWKKKFEKALLLHGSVPVRRDEVTESKDSILNFLIEENEELKNKIENISSKNKELSLELEKCAKGLDKSVELKISTEEILYGKFVQLLNAKKRRIQLLEESISKISKPNNG